MATLNLEILDAAHSDGLLPKRLTARQHLYLHSSILSGNQIYWLIAANPGIDVQQLEWRTKLHENTIKQFCRWLSAKGLIYSEATEQNPHLGMGRRYLFFTKKRHTIASQVTTH